MARFARVLASGRPFSGATDGEQWLEWINGAMPQEEIDGIRMNTSTGPPHRQQGFIENLNCAWTASFINASRAENP